MRPTQFIDALRRAVRWHRRAFAALFVAVAVLAALNSVASSSDPGAEVVVLARTVPGGSRLSAADLTIARLPAAAVPAGAITDAARAIGRTVVAALPARRALAASDLLGEAGLVAAGLVAFPIRFGEGATVALLQVGARIDVLGPSADGTGYGVVAGGVRVVAIPTGAGAGVFGAEQAPLVLVEVSPAQAAAIAAAAAVSAPSFALR